MAPFIQEDAAVIGAASMSIAGIGDSAIVFSLTVIALTASDYWKYWAGRLVRSHSWARHFATRPAASNAERLVSKNLGAALLTARFVPGTRIPLYVASGYFRASWILFAFWVALSAILYVGAAFALFHAIGSFAGQSARIWLPVISVTLLAGFLSARQFNKKRKGNEVAPIDSTASGKTKLSDSSDADRPINRVGKG